MFVHCQECAEWEGICLDEDRDQKGYEPRIHRKKVMLFIGSTAVSCEE
jgi:hypothetical protein